MDKELLGKNVVILSNDFCDDDLSASIIAIDELKKSILLKLKIELFDGHKKYGHAIASPRLSSGEIRLLLKNKSLTCSVTWVPNQKFTLESPMDLSWWRGSGAAITDLRILEIGKP